MRVVCAVVVLFVAVAATPTPELTPMPTPEPTPELTPKPTEPTPELETQSTPGETRPTPPDCIPFPSTPSNSTFCQRRPLNVRLTDRKWDGEIIAPKTYDAGYCSGACPGSVQTPHATVLARAHLAEEVAPQPCCVPLELEPISMLYFDHDLNIRYSKVQNMMVKTCGCR